MAQAEIGALRVRVAMDAGEFSRGARAMQSELDRIAAKMGDFGDRMNRIGLAMSAAITAPIAALGALSARSAAAFEKGMGNIATIVDTSSESMQAMGREVLDLSKILPVGLADLSTALYDIRSAGIGSAEAMAVLANSAKLAVAGLGSVQQSADIATSAMNAFGIQGAGVETMFSNIFQAAQFGKTTIAGLSQGFGAVAGTVANAGVKLDEYLSAIAALTTTGLPAAEAHTQIRAAIAGLMRDSELATKVLKTLGAKTFKELIEQSGGLVGAFEKIRLTLQGNDANLIKLLGSVEAYNALIGLTGKQNEVFRTSLTAMRSGVDTLGEAFGKQGETASAKWQLLMNAFERIKISIGTILMPALQTVASALESVASAFEGLSPETQRWVVIVAGVAAVIGPAVAAIGLMTAGIAALIPAIATVGTVIAGLVAASGPIGLFVVAASAAVTAWDMFKEQIIAIFDQVVGTISASIDAILARLTGLANTVGAVMSQLASGEFSAAIETMSGTATPAVKQLADAFGEVALQSGLVSVAVTNTAAAEAAAVPITDLSTTSRKALAEAHRLHNLAMTEGKRILEETQTPMEAIIAKQEKLNRLFSAGAISATTYGRAMAQATVFSAKNMDALASNVSSNLSAIFGESKAVAIATALINTYQGITKALASYPPPISTAMAAVQAAAGAVPAWAGTSRARRRLSPRGLADPGRNRRPRQCADPDHPAQSARRPL